MQSHISQLSSPCPKGSVGGVGKKDGLVKIDHFCIGPLQPGEVVMVVGIVDRHLRLNCSYFMVLGKLGPGILGPERFFVANWAPADWAPANWAPADWAPANGAPADWAPENFGERHIGPRKFVSGKSGPGKLGPGKSGPGRLGPLVADWAPGNCVAANRAPADWAPG